PRRQTLHDQYVGVAIHDETRQAIRLAMDQAAGVARKGAACGAGMLDTAAKEGRVDGLARIECPHASANLRCGAERRTREKCAIVGENIDRVTAFGRSGDFRDRTRENPGMALLERLLATWLEDQLRHDGP